MTKKKSTALSAKATEAARNMSRAERWQSAVRKAAIARDDIGDALLELADLQSEFEEWRDAMPDNLQGSSTYEKLDAICDLEIDRDAVLDPLDFLDEADGIDIPIGFGRD